MGDNDGFESRVISDVPFTVTMNKTRTRARCVNLLTILLAGSVDTRRDRFESWVSIAIRSARPIKCGRGVAVRRGNVVCKWPERRDLGRGECSDSLASLKKRWSGRDGDSERQEGKSELQGKHDCEVCTTGGLW